MSNRPAAEVSVRSKVAMTDATPSVLRLHGHDLSYVDRGAGPVVLLVHGLLGSHRQWNDVIDHLSSDYRVIAPDLMGHGASAKPLGDYSVGAHAASLRDLLDRLGIDKVTVVGHSLGGGIAMQLCYLFPDRVARLVLVSSGGLGRSVSRLLRSATLPGTEWILPLLSSRPVRAFGAGLGRALSKLGWKPGPDLTEGWNGLTALANPGSQQAFLATTRSVIDSRGQSVNAHADLLSTIAVPTLILWGTADKVVPVEHATIAHEAMAASRLELFDGAGHFPHHDQPELFAAALTSFLQSADDRDPSRSVH